MGQSKEIKQNQEGPKNFDICFSIIFSCHGQGLVSEKEIGNNALPPRNF